ncbi:hypothetical protein L226DRAFT_524415 [Lentinus tigrinus ALCF2SS1-7]|uniref:uncharacterized protein n=1 Tax=Lentinus tigrinus ALCF2SS1-7 TaxID=1328758 RepID=UPI001165F6D4|nr:hypothetical protein L226DRAFT_524415 [Lentinus tigrinus ALCF2SS1-7]
MDAYVAPDINTDTDDDDVPLAIIVKKNLEAKELREHTNPIPSSDDSSSDSDGLSSSAESEDIEKSEVSGLEEVEKDPRAIKALFDAEAATWADSHDVLDTAHTDNSHRRSRSSDLGHHHPASSSSRSPSLVTTRGKKRPQPLESSDTEDGDVTPAEPKMTVAQPAHGMQVPRATKRPAPRPTTEQKKKVRMEQALPKRMADGGEYPDTEYAKTMRAKSHIPNDAAQLVNVVPSEVGLAFADDGRPEHLVEDGPVRGQLDHELVVREGDVRQRKHVQLPMELRLRHSSKGPQRLASPAPSRCFSQHVPDRARVTRAHQNTRRANEGLPIPEGTQAVAGPSRHIQSGSGSGSGKRRKSCEDIHWAEDSGHDHAQKRARKQLTQTHYTKHGRNDPALDSSSSSASEDSNLSSDSRSPDNDSIELVMRKHGGRLRLKAQHPRVKLVAKEAIQETLTNICVINAYPEGPDKNDIFARDSLIRSAKALHDTEIAQRCKHDELYWRKLGTIPLQRISNFRGSIKKATDALVRRTYNLKQGDAMKVLWLEEGLRYVYPHDYQKKTIVDTDAYSTHIFVEALTDALFASPRSHGYRIVSRFASSLADKADEKEIPAAMLALVATALYASIDDYRGFHREPCDFKSNIFLDIYRQNIMTLSQYKHDRPIKFHRLMHSLFRAVCSSPGGGFVHIPAKSFLNTKDMVDE